MPALEHFSAVGAIQALALSIGAPDRWENPLAWALPDRVMHPILNGAALRQHERHMV